jgi:hypothetical protein
MKKLLVMVMLVALVPLASYAGTREEAIRASSELSATADALSIYARFRNLPKVSKTFRQIAKMADQAELLARNNGTKAQVAKVANDIISEYLNIRQDINTLPFLDRMVIKQSARLRINNLGVVVFTQFVPVKYTAVFAASGQQANPPVLTDEQKEALLDDLKQGQVVGDWSEQASVRFERMNPTLVEEIGEKPGSRGEDSVAPPGEGGIRPPDDGGFDVEPGSSQDDF